MSEIIAATQSLTPYLTKVQLKQLRHIIQAILGMTGRVTMLGLSRWTERGGSYRTIQRWFHSSLDWGMLLWISAKGCLPEGKPYLLAGDDVVTGKAGKETYGLGRFYSSIAQRVIPSLSFLVLSVIDVEKRHSYPIHSRQHPATVKPAKPQTEEKTVKRGRGRPKGRKNYQKAAPVLSADLLHLSAALTDIAAWIRQLNIRYLLLDGFFGNWPSTWLALQHGLHIISKLRCNAALFLPYAGDKPKRGPMPRYGERLALKNLPSNFQVSSLVEEDVCTQTYQVKAWNKEFEKLLNVVILVKSNSRTGKQAHVILFSTDLDLSAAQLVDYYSLRFQIEFNFRDAKQFWGLDDFMTIKPQSVTNAVNLAFLMVNLSAILLEPYRARYPDFSVLDLKAQFRAQHYLRETIKSFPDLPTPDFISRLWHSVSRCVGSLRPLHLDHLAA